MKKYQATLHFFSETNRYQERIVARCAINLNPIIEEIHEKYDYLILLLPNNIELHLDMLENSRPHITLELLQETF